MEVPPSPTRLPPPPKLPLPPLPGSRLSFDPTPPSPSRSMPQPIPRSPARSATTSNRTSTTTEDETEEGEDDSNCSGHSTSPSSLTPTLPVTPRADEKPPIFPSPRKQPQSSSPFPTRTDRPRGGIRPQPQRTTQEEGDSDEEEEEEDCGCGSPPVDEDESDDDLDVLEFVLRDTTLGLQQTNSTGPRVAGETGLGLFKRQGLEGLSLEPDQNVKASPPQPRRPSSAHEIPPPPVPVAAAVGDSTSPPKSVRPSTAPTKFRLRLPRAANSSESDEPPTSGDDSDGTLARRVRRKKSKKAFDRFIMPSAEDLAEARKCELVGETGLTVTLEEIVKQRGRVVFVGLRHFWCGLCAQYVAALREAMISLVAFQNSVTDLSSTASSVSVGDYHSPRAIIPPLYIVLVSTGSHKLIPTYRQRLDCPFPLYVDRSRKLYKALGMTKKTFDMGKEADKGSYIVKTNWQNVVESTKAGLAMPRYPGPQSQLGGEFVFDYNEDDDSITCNYASRMHTTRAHAEIRDLFAAAGVELNDADAESVYGESVYTQASST